MASFHYGLIDAEKARSAVLAARDKGSLRTHVADAGVNAGRRLRQLLLFDNRMAADPHGAAAFCVFYMFRGSIDGRAVDDDRGAPDDNRQRNDVVFIRITPDRADVGQSAREYGAHVRKINAPRACRLVMTVRLAQPGT
jgi:hypothetical protein